MQRASTSSHVGETDLQRVKSRREALVVLGLSAATVYAAPVVTRIDTARAAFPSQCPPPRSTCRSNSENGRNQGRGHNKHKDW